MFAALQCTVCLAQFSTVLLPHRAIVQCPSCTAVLELAASGPPPLSFPGVYGSQLQQSSALGVFDDEPPALPQTTTTTTTTTTTAFRVYSAPVPMGWLAPAGPHLSMSPCQIQSPGPSFDSLWSTSGPNSWYDQRPRLVASSPHELLPSAPKPTPGTPHSSWFSETATKDELKEESKPSRRSPPKSREMGDAYVYSEYEKTPQRGHVRTCRCGSTTHQRSTHHRCPFNALATPQALRQVAILPRPAGLPKPDSPVGTRPAGSPEERPGGRSTSNALSPHEDARSSRDTSSARE
eukprot:m.84768 g.84768  ORF g.84768 m.84768 type:complete len:293 (+) comp50850_c0_seq1:369-1247(+)